MADQPDFDLDVAVSQLRQQEHKPRARAPRDPRPDPRHEADVQYREAYGDKPFGSRMRAPFYTVIGDAPRGRYLTRDDAAAYVGRIDTAIEMDCWTAKERGRLMTLRKLWDRRARGEDARFLRCGNAPGRPPKNQPRDANDVLQAIYAAIRESAGVTRDRRIQYTTEWPLGKPVIR